MPRLEVRSEVDPRTALYSLGRSVWPPADPGGYTYLVGMGRDATREEAIEQITDEVDEMVTLASVCDRRESIGRAARCALHLLGWELFLMGLNTGEMGRVLEAAAARKDDPEYGRRAGIIDHAWDRIGSGTDRWIA